MNKLKSYFQSVGFNDIDTNEIVSHFKTKIYNKGAYFVKEGMVSTQLSFIETGQFQYFSINDLGEERTSYISLPNTFMASILTYVSETPSRESIKALSNATLWIIEKKDVEALQNKIQSFKDFYIKLIEWQICCIDKNRFDLITLTSEQRYEKLIKEEPELLQQVPLQYIASMLGMTPRHLSRLRSKL